MDQSELETLVAKWQKILRLQDWNVVIKFVRTYNMLANSQGSVVWELKKRTAVIRILDPVDFDKGGGWEQDIEQTVVHELVHLHLASIDEFDRGSVKEMLLEQAVDSFAQALVTLDRART